MRKWIDIILENVRDGPHSLKDVALHFISIHDDLLDDDADTSNLADISDSEAIAIIQKNYISGSCGAFAIALHDKLGLPIVAINGGFHIAVRAQDGDIIDFLGKNSVSKVLRRYGMNQTAIISIQTREQVEDDIMMDDEPDNPWNDIAIAKWVMATLNRW